MKCVCVMGGINGSKRNRMGDSEKWFPKCNKDMTSQIVNHNINVHHVHQCKVVKRGEIWEGDGWDVKTVK